MNDKNGKPITPGATLKRIVEGRGAPVGYEYTAILYDFYGDGTEHLVADGGFVKELLTSERAKEFEVIE
jgi:hypothetical protein